jgi:hypothetical protein
MALATSALQHKRRGWEHANQSCVDARTCLRHALLHCSRSGDVVCILVLFRQERVVA